MHTEKMFVTLDRVMVDYAICKIWRLKCYLLMAWLHNNYSGSQDKLEISGIYNNFKDHFLDLMVNLIIDVT